MATPNQVAARGKPSANYPFVMIANADAMRWASRLIKSRHVGVIYSNQSSVVKSVEAEAPHAKPLGVAPAAALPVTQADNDLVIGVISDGSAETNDTEYLMVVDTRVGMSVGAVAKIIAKLTLSPSSQATVVPPGEERTLESMEVKVTGSTITATLDDGGGALFAVKGSGCGAVLRSV